MHPKVNSKFIITHRKLYKYVAFFSVLYHLAIWIHYQKKKFSIYIRVKSQFSRKLIILKSTINNFLNQICQYNDK